MIVNKLIRSTNKTSYVTVGKALLTKDCISFTDRISTCSWRTKYSSDIARLYTFNSPALLSYNVRGFSSAIPSLTSHKAFSTVISVQGTNANIVVQELKKEEDIVRRVKNHLHEMDKSNDGMIDAEKLKELLRRVGGFTDKEIFELGELFYAGRGGKAATQEDFLRSIAQVVREKDKIGSPYVDEVVASEESNAVVHRRVQKTNHPLGLGSCSTEYMFGKQRGVYSDEELDVKLTHVQPTSFTDRTAFASVKIVRLLFDAVSLWNFGEITQAKVMRRVIFLETVAAIPGFVAAMVRHFRSLRTMSRDGGMLNMFLDEANNERMHLLTFVKMRDPSQAFRVMVMVSQTLVGAGFFILYHLSPAFCHRFVGYIEEEACSTYTKIIKTIEEAPEGSEMAEWRTQLAPAIGRAYWHLGGDGTVLDLMYAIRADEAEHRDVNHACSGFRDGQINPLYNPQEKFDEMLLKYVKQMMERGEKDRL